MDFGNTQHLPRWMWHKEFECVVQIVGTGHFPSTATVKLPNGEQVETDIDKLQSRDNLEI